MLYSNYMLFFVFNKMVGTSFGQEEINTGVEMMDTNGVEINKGSESLTDEEVSGSISSTDPVNTLTGLSGYIDSIIFLIIVISITVTIYFIIRFFINKSANSLGLDRRQLSGINSITKMILIVSTVIIIIFHFSSLSGVAAGAISVAAGTIIGFSSRNTISNAIAGILLLSARPFKLGDRIRTTEDESLIGDVVEISLLYTKIKTVRNELVAIPNQTLLQRQIVNYSGLDVLSITVNVSMTYNHNRKLIERLLVEAAINTDGIITSQSIQQQNSAAIKYNNNKIDEVKNGQYSNTNISPTPISSPDNAVTDPFVMLVKFGEYGAVYDLRAFTKKPREFLKIASELRKKIYDLFQEHGIDLTLPQTQIGIDKGINKEYTQDNSNF